MKRVKVKVILEEGVKFKPSYQTYGSAGADVFPLMGNGESYALKPGERKLFKTGIKMEIPTGYEIQVRPRSGLALKHGISVLNSPGTIDSDYTGFIGVILFNNSDEPFYVKQGDRIAQAVLNKVSLIEWDEKELLVLTKRGEGGFGHTGN